MFLLNKKMLVVSIAGVLLLTSFNAKVDGKEVMDKNTSLVKVENITQKDKEIEFIDGIYGLYGDAYDNIQVFKGKDENHMYIMIDIHIQT